MKHKISLFIPVIALTVLVSGCGKKDPASLDSKTWIDRNDKCAVEAIGDITSRLEEKIKKSEEISKQIQAELLKGNCPLASSPECIPEVGVQAIATYISSAASRIKPISSSDIIEDKDVGSISDAFKTLKSAKAGKKVKVNLKEKKKPETIEVKKEEIVPYLTGELLEKKSLCAMKVQAKCKFETMDKIVAKLVIFANQMRNYEIEIRQVLNVTGVKPDSGRIYDLYMVLKTLESNISDLVNREDASLKNYKIYGPRYESIEPLKLKGLLINVTAAIPASITSILRKYGPSLKNSQKMYVKNSEGFKSRLRSQTKKLTRDRRMNANHCLDMKGCWNFRTCLNRFSLPGILLFK